MTQRKLHCINWNTFKQDLITALNCIQPGETRFWDLPQDFDKELRYAIVLGYDEEGELSIMLGCEDADADQHRYGVEWRIPVVREERWDTENWISKEEVKKPESIRDRVEYLKNQWDHLQKYLKADMYSKFNYRKETCRMFNNEMSTSHLREFLADLDKAEDPNADFECFCSSDLGRLGVGNVLTWWLWEKNWAPDALIEGFDEDPVTATGISAVAPNNAHYFQLRNDQGKRILNVMYDRPVGAPDGIPECRATYIIEFNKDLNKWQIVHAKVGL